MPPICWVSLVPPLPLLALSIYSKVRQAIERAVLNMSWGGFGAQPHMPSARLHGGFPAIWSLGIRI